MEYNNTPERMAAKLTRQWKSFCEENRLPLMSADELLAEYGSSLPLDMKREVEMFIERWELFV